ncbi:MAG TPA: HAD family hydrolase, partial [Ktedonobacterales bacterium]|nr:HAD family hydrolase [Ktedonobacterales bacterium]
LFDLDETLAPDDTTDRAIFAELDAAVAQEYSVSADALVPAIDRAAGDRWEAAPTAAYCARIGIHAWEGLWGPFGPSADPMLAALHAFAPGYRVAAWTAALAACGIHDPASGAALAERFSAERRARQAAYPWSRAVLDSLRPRHRLGLITNGAPDLQRLKLGGTGLADYFDPIVVSGELGVGKPEPAIFAHALARAGIDSSAAIMIGDSWARDIQGALGAGLRAVWINPRGTPAPDSVAGVAIIPDLRALPEVLTRSA